MWRIIGFTILIVMITLVVILFSGKKGLWMTSTCVLGCLFVLDLIAFIMAAVSNNVAVAYTFLVLFLTCLPLRYSFLMVCHLEGYEDKPRFFDWRL